MRTLVSHNTKYMTSNIFSEQANEAYETIPNFNQTALGRKIEEALKNEEYWYSSTLTE